MRVDVLEPQWISIHANVMGADLNETSDEHARLET